MESFFGTLKTELVHQREYPDRDTARRDLFAYIEGYYHRSGSHSGQSVHHTLNRQRRNPHNPVSTLREVQRLLSQLKPARRQRAAIMDFLKDLETAVSKPMFHPALKLAWRARTVACRRRPADDGHVNGNGGQP